MRSAIRLGVLLLLAACGSPQMTMRPPDGGAALPTFALVDVNPASATSGQRVGPETFRGKVSGWYFTHTT